MKMLKRVQKYFLTIATASFMLLLLHFVTAFPSSAPASQNPDSVNVIAKDIFDVTEAKMLIIYPKGKPNMEEPHRSNPSDREGSFVTIVFDSRYENVTLYAISFHSFESCSIYTAALENSPFWGAGCNDVPRSAYSPEEFKKQYLAFQNEDSLAGYDILTTGGKSCFYSCYYAEGGEVYVVTGITFNDDIRINVQMVSNNPYNCDKVYEECKNLLSKIEFEAYE